MSMLRITLVLATLLACLMPQPATARAATLVRHAQRGGAERNDDLTSIAGALASLPIEASPGARPQAVIVCPSLAQLDRAWTQLLRAMEWTTASTLSQILNSIGVLHAIDLERPIAVLIEPGQRSGAAVVAIVPTRNGDRFEAALRVQPAGEAGDGGQAFELDLLNRSLVGARLSADTVALASSPAALDRVRAHDRRAADWLGRLPEAGQRALAAAPVAVVAPSATSWRGWLRECGVVASGDGLPDLPAVVAISPGPLGLRIDGHAGCAVGDGRSDPQPGGVAQLPTSRAPLATLNREGALLAAQLDCTHPAVVRALAMAARCGHEPIAALASRLAGGAHKVGLVVRSDGAERLLAATWLDLLARTAVHWTGPDPAGDVRATAAAMQRIVEHANQSSPGYPANGRDHARFALIEGAGDGAASHRLGRSTTTLRLVLPTGTLGQTNLNTLRQRPIAFLAARRGPLTLSSAVSWDAGHGAVTFQRSLDESATEHRACEPGASVDADPVLNQVRSVLPAGRFAEASIDSRMLLDALMLVLEPGARFALPAVVPPTAMTIGSNGDALHAGLFVPALVLKPLRSLQEPIAAALIGVARPAPPAE